MGLKLTAGVGASANKAALAPFQNGAISRRSSVNGVVLNGASGLPKLTQSRSSAMVWSGVSVALR